jgi:hypothetical protein
VKNNTFHQYTVLALTPRPACHCNANVAATTTLATLPHIKPALTSSTIAHNTVCWALVVHKGHLYNH